MVAPSLIADRLRDEILDLRLEQGEPLREISIAERFGASRRSVREALLMLAQEGIVTHEKHRGARVRSFTADDVTDLYAARAVLESTGARACGDASDDALDGVLVALAHLRRAATEGQNSSRHAIADVQFHAAVIALAGSPRLDRFFASIRNEMTLAIRILQREEVASGWRDEDALRGHVLIADALLERDADTAEAAVREHIKVNERLLRSLALSEG
ncbi:GntR family transcriptional regulator [Microbacterium oleivorans]|uniref:GntR family transcriptional regulator n=1 Tax=Microbacterium oleivorans TaxID=273677 RepID=UPI00203C1368|nr:GntR family transcriptional regulator [Microbacterium oleivorans]MCM3695101.1 GntR family transcriptional regulator [Microbacterium oleivorans]